MDDKSDVSEQWAQTEIDPYKKATGSKVRAPFRAASFVSSTTLASVPGMPTSCLLLTGDSKSYGFMGPSDCNMMPACQ